jgi:flagellar biosynthesis/type III secretory pathway protein FliH
MTDLSAEKIADRIRSLLNVDIAFSRQDKDNFRAAVEEIREASQAAYDRGFKDGDKCTENSVKLAYEQGFKDALEKGLELHLNDGLKEVEERIRQLKPKGD